MRQVAERLQIIAEEGGAVDDVNAFTRSAFNRYYYCVYLLVRGTLREKNPGWSKVAHKSMPVVLKGEVLKEIKSIIRAQEKSSVLAHGNAEALRHKAISVTGELSDLLTEAYAIRCSADYEPETPVSGAGGSLALAGKKLSVASTWPRRAEMAVGHLKGIWRELGVPV